MDTIKEKTIAFTGNRTLTTSNGQPDNNLENVIRTELNYVLEELYQEGKTIFLCCMTVGFDMLAAEVILGFRKTHPDVKLYVVIPFKEQDRGFDWKDKVRYQQIIQSADDTHIIYNSEYSNDGYLKYYDYLADNASEIITYSDGKENEILNIINKASSNGVGLLNLYDELQDYFNNSSFAKHLLQNYSAIHSLQFGRDGIFFSVENELRHVCYGKI